MTNRSKALFLLGTVFLTATPLFKVIDLYYIRSDSFNENGRFFDAETGVVYHQQDGIFWLLLTLFLTGFAIFQIWRWRRA